MSGVRRRAASADMRALGAVAEDAAGHSASMLDAAVRAVAGTGRIA